ncbi:MAG: N-acetyl-gamma-glutamyl-phosphate reductase, partial [Desulfovibrio piger]
MKIFKVGLVGVTGYTGMELARLLASHPRMKLEMACSRTESGLRLGEFYPFLEGLPGSDVVISIFDAKEAARRCDLVFLAVPHGKAMEMAGELLEAGTRVIDLSADFRLRDVNVYEDWYVPHTRRELLPEAVYGLPELYAAETAKARLVANPGCYPSSAILGLYAAFKHGLISPDNIVIDSKSGTSGAGRKPVVPSLFCEVYDTFRAYGLGKHRHTPEIEQEYSRAAGCDVRVSFNPHLVPMVRG